MPKHGKPTTAKELLDDFNVVLGVRFDPPQDLMTAAQDAINGCTQWTMRDKEERKSHLVALVNSKLKLNKERLQELLDAAAVHRLFPNYHDKAEILECLDYSDKCRFENWLIKNSSESELLGNFRPVTLGETLSGLHQLLATGTVNRSDARTCDLSERQTEILRSLFGSFVFHAFPTEAMHCHFNRQCNDEYKNDFFQHLIKYHGSSLRRDCALVFLRVDESLTRRCSPQELRDSLCGFIAKTYERLANHCVLAIEIEPFLEGSEDGQWRLFSDLVLYAEKHREVKLRTGYFRPAEIQSTTVAHIPELDTEAARFELANEGFFYRDCIVLSTEEVEKASKDSDKPGNILLLFDKNERDETVIPCPACRSMTVAGNSYPALGVRSWECRNPICPDRSAFDRGNRYSLSAIIKQEAIKSDADQIPEWSLRRWKLDVASGIDHDAVVDMLIRHFSLHGDTVVFVNGASSVEERHGRKVVHEVFDPSQGVRGEFENFQQSPLFRRFLLDKKAPKSASPNVFYQDDVATVIQGDCFDVLMSLPKNSIDGAVTSPPYYNAREYSTWPNIYCYLHDMYNAARGVFRVLKPGGYYVFNIFDYFDNENSVVFSAMGKKRMVLGAYIVNAFSRVGFELTGNVVWYKGEIEGKRNYNQGNRSPYYQVPLNCWEHCFVFRKPGDSPKQYTFPRILDAKPVFKMVRGENILGHTAPYPPAIPELLISRMSCGERVLDPYSGSMTTGRTAARHGINSTSVEMQVQYCELGVRLFEEEKAGITASNGKRAVADSPQSYLPGF